MTSSLTPNPYSQLLATKRVLLANAQRFALGTTCDPMTSQPAPINTGRRQLKHLQINARIAGDNVVIPATAGRKDILELFMWNVSAQTVIWQQGFTANGNVIVFTELPAFPALSGFVLGMVARWDMPHWEVDANQPLIVNLAAGTQLTGFIRYRVPNGTTIE